MDIDHKPINTSADIIAYAHPCHVEQLCLTHSIEDHHDDQNDLFDNEIKVNIWHKVKSDI